MKKVIDVQIGEVSTGQGEIILESKAIGSCIAVVAYDAGGKTGAMAHIMLPGSAPASKKAGERTKYAADAVDAIISKMSDLGSTNDGIDVFLVGGGNVLNREDDTICKDNIESTLEILNRRGLKVKAQVVGGTKRRSVSLDIERGIVSYSEGDGSEKQLWKV